MNLTILGSQLNNGQSLADLAQSLAQSALFFDKHYPAQLSHAEFAASFINDLIGSRASESNKNLLIDFSRASRPIALRKVKSSRR